MLNGLSSWLFVICVLFFIMVQIVRPYGQSWLVVLATTFGVALGIITALVMQRNRGQGRW